MSANDNKIDERLPLRLSTARKIVNRSVADRKFVLVMMTIFAALALALTVFGLYGVLDCLVSRRTPEIGIRMALGAKLRRIMRLIVRHGVCWLASVSSSD